MMKQTGTGTGIQGGSHGEIFCGIPLNPWERQSAIKALYARCVEEACVRHGITRMELDILLFLANNPRFDTATDIVAIRYLSKSQVSASLKLLEAGGYVEKIYREGNRKTAHLKICEGAAEIVADGRAAQEKFFKIMMRGFDREEVEHMETYMNRIWDNIRFHLKEAEEK